VCRVRNWVALAIVVAALGSACGHAESPASQVATASSIGASTVPTTAPGGTTVQAPPTAGAGGVAQACAIMAAVTAVGSFGHGVVPRQSWDNPATVQALSSAMPLIPSDATFRGESVGDHFRRLLTAANAMAALTNDKSLHGQDLVDKEGQLIESASPDIAYVLAWVAQECDGMKPTSTPGIK